MTEEEMAQAGTAALNADPKLLFGFDVPRHWATGAQVLAAPNGIIVVFREQMGVQVQQPDGSTTNGTPLVRNVSSVVLPLDVAAELGRILSAEAERISKLVSQNAG